jgi:hypothetical protein
VYDPGSSWMTFGEAAGHYPINMIEVVVMP